MVMVSSIAFNDRRCSWCNRDCGCWIGRHFQQREGVSLRTSRQIKHGRFLQRRSKRDQPSLTSALHIVMLAICWCCSCPGVDAEVRVLDYSLPPGASYIAYDHGHLIAPANIDVSNLHFIFGDEGYGARKMDDGERKMSSSMDGKIDVVFFRLPHDNNCGPYLDRCDLVDFGVGAYPSLASVSDSKNSDGSTGVVSMKRHWCCGEEAVELGLCSKESGEYNQLIVDAHKLHGVHRRMVIPEEGNLTKQLDDYHVEADSGQYVLAFANCNPQGREVFVRGTATWMSRLGYLPGQFYGYLLVSFLIMLGYLTLSIKYWSAMRKFPPGGLNAIERVIAWTLLFGLIQSTFRTIEVLVWNVSGGRPAALMFLRITSNVILEAMAWCLVLTIAVGRGFTETISNLGLLYVGLASLRGILLFCEATIDSFDSIGVYVSIKVLSWFMTFLVCVLGVMALCAVQKTITRLVHLNQGKKVHRYRRFRNVVIAMMMIIVICRLANTLMIHNDRHGDGYSLRRFRVAILFEICQCLIYLFAVGFISILWIPSPDSTEYANVMQTTSYHVDEDDLYPSVDALPALPAPALPAPAAPPSALPAPDYAQKVGGVQENDTNNDVDMLSNKNNINNGNNVDASLRLDSLGPTQDENMGVVAATGDGVTNNNNDDEYVVPTTNTGMSERQQSLRGWFSDRKRRGSNDGTGDGVWVSNEDLGNLDGVVDAGAGAGGAGSGAGAGAGAGAAVVETDMSDAVLTMMMNDQQKQKEQSQRGGRGWFHKSISSQLSKSISELSYISGISGIDGIEEEEEEGGVAEGHNSNNESNTDDENKNENNNNNGDNNNGNENDDGVLC